MKGLRQAVWQKFLGAIAILSIAGCVIPIPPRPISTHEVPTITSTSCNVSIVRKKQLFGSLIGNYISLDGYTVATLGDGEYTVFPVSEGWHLLEVTWRYPDNYLSYLYLLLWSTYKASHMVECKPLADIYFTISIKTFPQDEWRRVDFKQVEFLENDFTPEKNKYISPGLRQIERR